MFYHILSIKITLRIDRLTTRSQHTRWTILYAVINYSKESATEKSQNLESEAITLQSLQNSD